jgi:hypothetical protein
MAFITPNYYDAVRLNKILFENYCANIDPETGDVLSFIFPYVSGTIRYIEALQVPQSELPSFVVDETMQDAANNPNLSIEDRVFIADLLATAHD